MNTDISVFSSSCLVDAKHLLHPRDSGSTARVLFFALMDLKEVYAQNAIRTTTGQRRWGKCPVLPLPAQATAGYAKERQPYD